MKLTVEVWVASGGYASPYERRPDVEAQIADYDLHWQAGHPERGVFRSAARWACVELDDTLIDGERVQPALPLIRLDVYYADVLVWRGWAVEERYVAGQWHYEAWGLTRVAQTVTLWNLHYGIESVDEAFLQGVAQILQAWDGGRTPYTLQANCPKRVAPEDFRAGVSGAAFLEALQARAPRHFVLEGEWGDGRWGVRLREPKQMPVVVVQARVDEQSLRMHTVRNRVQVIGAADFEANRTQRLKNGDLTGLETVKQPRDLIDDPQGMDVGNSGYWSLTQNVVSDAELGGGYTGNTFARFTASSGCKLHSAVKSIVGYEGLTWRGRVALRKGDVTGSAQVAVMIKARDPVLNQTTTLWIGVATLAHAWEWQVLESPPVSPRPGYTQMWLEIESAGGDCNGVRLDAIHLFTSGQRLRDWEVLWRPWTTNLPQAGYGYADPHANAGMHGLDGGAQVWLEPGWMFGQRIQRENNTLPDATVYCMLWYTRGSYNNAPVEPKVVLWQSAWVWQYGSVWEEGNFESTGTVRWRLYRWQNIALGPEFWIGLWSDLDYLWGVSVWGMWCGIAPVDNATGFLGAGNFGKYWADGFRTGYLPYTNLGFALTPWMSRSAIAWGERYARYDDYDAGRVFELGAPEAWRLRTQVAAEPYRQLRVSAALERVEQLQPHRYLWRVGLEDYFVGTLTLSSNGQMEASLHEPEADLIRALRSVL